MIRHLFLLLAIVPGLAVLPARAADTHLFSADVLSKFCNSPHGAPYDDGVCAGYVTAIADVLLHEPGMADRLCMPRNLSTSDFSKLVTRHVRATSGRQGITGGHCDPRGATEGVSMLARWSSAEPGARWFR